MAKAYRRLFEKRFPAFHIYAHKIQGIVSGG
jgi:hypothetical protein